MFVIDIDDFSLQQIADSGQCFRFHQIKPNSWLINFGNNTVEASQYGKIVTFYCSEAEFNSIWRDYFDLDYDYGKLKSYIIASEDAYLSAAVQFGYGLRILHQDLWETIVSFIISQRNSIPRIKNTISKLCAMVGQFPSAQQLINLSTDELKSLGLGYRIPYIKNIAQTVNDSSFDLSKLRKMNYQNAIDYLKTQHGIGDKVANCIALFGLQKKEAFPIDTWIKRIIDKQYGGQFDIDRFSGYAGVVQQYMFFYQRNGLAK